MSWWFLGYLSHGGNMGALIGFIEVFSDISAFINIDGLKFPVDSRVDFF